MMRRHLDPRTILLAAGLLCIHFLSSCGSDPNAGAIGTGNAGRVQGQVDVAGTASPGRLAARLVSTGPSGQVVDSTWCETDGTFRFPEHATGDYRVEIWQGEKFRGSRAFHLEGDVSGLLVVLVEAVFQQELDLSKIGEVDSVFVDYRQNQGVHVGSRWVVQTTADSAFVVHAHVVGPPARWEEWVMVKREGKDVLLNLSDSRSLDPTRKIDSGAFLLGSHTVALWNFDSLLQTGEILDRSPFANHLRYDGTPQLVPSPHGKAFSQSSGLAASVPRSGQLPPSLQWTRTGLMTWEIRFRMDTVPLSGMVVFGSKSGLRLWITGIGQLVVESPVHGADGIEIGSLVSAPEVVPLGKWIDIAISVDAPNRQVYAWVDEMAIPLAARQNWSNGTSMDLGADGEFGIGGAVWDPRQSQFQIDEARISDTLVYGVGLPLKETMQISIYPASSGEVAQVFDQPSPTSCDSCQGLLVGREDSTGRIGAIAWRPSLPAILQGKHIASAYLILWTHSLPVTQRRDFTLRPILSSWSASNQALVWGARSGTPFGSMSGALADDGSLLIPGNSGGLVFESARIVQAWASHPETNHGFLVRSSQEALPATRFQGPGESRAPSLVVRYW